MARISWKFYSARRKIKSAELVKRGVVKDYETFLQLCKELDVIPSTREEFSSEFGGLLSPGASSVPVLEKISPSVSSEPEQALIATVLLSGVDDSSVATISSADSASELTKKRVGRKSKPAPEQE